MDSTQVLERAGQSLRVRDLLAATIRVGVQQVFGYRMRLGEARDLARVHTLPTALDRIQLKMDVHEGIRNLEVRFRLAVQETVLEGHRGSAIGKVVEVRGGTIGMTEKGQDACKSHAAMLADLRDLKSHISEWGKSYRKFIRQLGRLYRQRRWELRAAKLGFMETKTALAELDEIFVSAIQRSGQVFLRVERKHL